jgi:hypothetical protein
MIPVEGHANLFRDPSSGAIINKDRTNAGIAKAARKKLKEDEVRLDNVENQLSEIKDLLTKLLEKKK